MLSYCTLPMCVLLTVLPAVQGLCGYNINSPAASAAHTVLGPGSFFSYSCTPCIRQDVEIHVLNMYQPYHPQGGPLSKSNGTQAVTVTIEAAAQTDIKLVLMSHDAVHWVLVKPAHITITHIILVSYHNDSAVDVHGPSLPRLTHEDTFITGWDSAEMEAFVTQRLGFLSSYTGVYETLTWTLTVGECETHKDFVTTPRPITKGPAAPRRKAKVPMVIEGEESAEPRYEYIIIIVAAVAIIISLALAFSAAPRQSRIDCYSKLKHIFCFCFIRNQSEDSDDSLERPARLLVTTPSAPSESWTEPETPSAPTEEPHPPPSAPGLAPHTPAELDPPPPAYQDAMDYPRPETPPPSYNSV